MGPAVFSLAPQSLLGAVLEVSLAVTALAAEQEGQRESSEHNSCVQPAPPPPPASAPSLSEPHPHQPLAPH